MKLNELLSITDYKRKIVIYRPTGRIMKFEKTKLSDEAILTEYETVFRGIVDEAFSELEEEVFHSEVVHQELVWEMFTLVIYIDRKEV